MGKKAVEKCSGLPLAIRALGRLLSRFLSNTIEWENITSNKFLISNSEQRYFVMHDLIHDLAIYVMGDFGSTLDPNLSINISEKLHHFSYKQSIYDSDVKLVNSHRLRTFLPVGSGTSSIDQSCNYYLSNSVLQPLKQLGCLRVLSLCGYKITHIPDLIGGLKLLRYLDFSFTYIEELPDSICDLSNLQTLLLSYCERLRNLLLYLDIRGQTIECADAYQANLSSKAHLDELVLEREDSETIFQSQSKKVIDALTPLTKLGRLTICKNIGKEFPNWVRDKAFCRLKFLHIKRCLCVKLPSLGQLPFLKHLIIEDFKNLDIVGEEFNGKHNESSLSYKSLGHGGEVEPFHCLEKFSVWDCESLEGYIPLRLPSLVALDIHSWYELEGSLPKLLNLRILNLIRFGNLDLNGLAGTTTLIELSLCGTPWESNYNKWITNAKEALPLMTSLKNLSIEVYNMSKQGWHLSS
ncbi:putative disease resistance RPP13-like protein 1 [Bienertia sinuspersici]